MSLNLHKFLNLYTTSDKFYIQSFEQPDEALVIDRKTCQITLSRNFSQGQVPGNTTSSLIFGIIGIKHLLTCPYLIVISKATQIGSINGQTIYRMDEARMIPLDIEVEFYATSTPWNDTYLAMLNSVLKTPNFYFSYTYDLTNSSQRIDEINEQLSYPVTAPNVARHRYYDTRFLWNRHLMGFFDKCEEEAGRFRLPLIHGFIGINQSKVLDGRVEFMWTLVSRRSNRRAGTRFNCRGLDYDGNAANFVETEQIVEGLDPGMKKPLFSSYVQIRGSIPLMWSQKANYKYMPKIEIHEEDDYKIGMKKHFDQLSDIYGKVSVVNLIDKKGREGELESKFEQSIGQIQKTNAVSYHYFDFHKECSKMRWHRLTILLDSLEPTIQDYGYYYNYGAVPQPQKGVIRTNCIDSLDRTNVVQSMLARKVLDLQLKGLFNIPEGQLDSESQFMNVFKNTWADNADFLSIQYAGTPALKTDFTRTGKRTQVGLMKDGINSLTRYVYNNFNDLYRQDAIDLFLGNFEGYPSPLYRPMDLSNYTSTIPVTIVVLTFVILYIYLRH